MFNCFRLFKFLIIYATSFILVSEVVLAQYVNAVDVKAEQKIEEHDEAKLDKVLIDYNKDQVKVNNDLQKILENNTNNTPDITDEELSAEELKEFDAFANDAKKMEALKNSLPDYKKLPIPKNLEGKKLSENLGFMLGPLRQLKDKELRSLLIERSKGTQLEWLGEKDPRVYTFIIKLIKDKDALVRLVSISEDTDRLKKFFWIIIGTFILGYFFKRITTHSEQLLISAFFWGLIRLTVMFAIRLGVIWSMFGDELSPSVKIVKSVFFQS